MCLGDLICLFLVLPRTGAMYAEIVAPWFRADGSDFDEQGEP